jgi:enamine deaminase RidA (YjgF/YER057c/UK114 family)
MTAPRRQSITIDGFGHGAQPIPAACRLGQLLMTGGVHGIDRASGKLAERLEDQVEHMFANLAAILSAAGGSMDDVVKMTIFTARPEARTAVNDAWIRAFPDADARPARHTLDYPGLRAPMLVQCDAVAFLARDVA